MPQLSKFIKSLAFIVSVLAISLSLGYLVSAWTEPTVAPPTGNVSTPLNVSSTGQSKAGGLILNTGGAPNGLIVQNGNVGIGTTNPTQKLDVVGYVKGQSGLCIGGDCRTSWPVLTCTQATGSYTSTNSGIAWSVNCPAGYTATGGGGNCWCTGGAGISDLWQSFPQGTPPWGWFASCSMVSGSGCAEHTVTVYAVCCKIQ